MKQKYYLRGLGLGILITSLVFIVAGPSELSEEEIIKRAEELGYTKIEEDVTPSIGIKELLETGTPVPTKTQEVPLTLTPDPTETPSPAPVTPVVMLSPTEAPTGMPTEKPTEMPEETVPLTPVPTEGATVIPTETPTPKPTVAPTETPIPTSLPTAEVVTAVIVVERGNTATVVCNKIEEAGILEDGKVLRNYLVDNKLTDYINIGTYTLSSDMSIKEMADLLTGR